MPQHMASSTGLELLVVNSNLTSIMKTLFKEKCVNNLINGNRELATSTRMYGLDVNIPPFQGGRVL